MDSTDAGNLSHSLEAARVVPIAELSPDLPDPAATVVGGVVTITWPYNKVKGTFAFSLAEPDFRLRRNRGQVRIDFTSRAAEAVGECGLGSNDEVLLSLAGAAWEAETTNKRRSLPGADLGWKLIFSERLSLEIKRTETNETDLIVVNEQPNNQETTPAPTPTQPPAVTESPSPPDSPSPTHTTSPVRENGRKRFHDGEFASPAFVKRARMSYGSLFEDGFDIFQENNGKETRGRKRTIFGRDSSAWRYASRTPSPEPAAASPEEADGQASSPDRLVSSPNKVRMADEGCQTIELDRSPPPPVVAPLETYAELVVPEDFSRNDAPSDAYTEPVIEPAQVSPLNDLPPEIGAQNGSALDTGEVPDFEVGVQPSSKQQTSPPPSNLVSDPWNVDILPSALEQQHEPPFPPLNVDESLASPGFGNIEPNNQPIPVDESDSLNKQRLGNAEGQGSINDGIMLSSESDPPTFNYPALGLVEDIHPQPTHDEAITNYPASYLEGSHMSPPSQMMEEQIAQMPAVAESGPSSWATINQPSDASTMPLTDRLGSRDGTTPEQALVIDESDPESDSSPKPIAVEDTLNDGRAYALGMYEDAEAEDEVDAQYSDDDEPEYDPNEMGGDYDTRNYERPDDDDDGEYEEDLQPHHLDPEFDEEESWDEEEQEELLNEEDEGEYELDEGVSEPEPEPIVRANPTVIDLISSSEDESEDVDDEGEDEDDTTTGIQAMSARIDARTSPSHQKTSFEDNAQQVHLNDDDSEIISQASISDNSSEAGVENPGYSSSHRGDEGQDGEDPEDQENEDDEDDEDEDKYDIEGNNRGDGIGREIESETHEREEASLLEPLEQQAEQHPEEQHAEEQHLNEQYLEEQHAEEQHPELENHLGRDTELQGDMVLGGTDADEDELSRQAEIQTEIFGSPVIENIRESSEERLAIVPFSAADGLEILSRAVEEESSARSHGLFAESAMEKVVTQTISDEQSSTEASEEDVVEMQKLLDNQLNTALEAVLEMFSEQENGEEQINEVDPIAQLKRVAEHPPDIRARGPTAAAPSSPSLTHSFPSQIEGEDDFTFTDAVSTPAAQIATTQLPTPLDTQVTDTTLNTSTSIHMRMADSFGSYTTIEQPDAKSTEDLVVEEPVAHPVPQDINTSEDDIEQGHNNTLVVEIEAWKPTDTTLTTSSPAPSFQSQVDDGESIWSESDEQTQIDSQLIQGFSPDHDSDQSDSSESFAPHIGIDEELQASILEDSLPEEHDIDEEPQASIPEDSLPEEYDIDEELQASILEDSLLEEHDIDEEPQASIPEDSLPEAYDIDEELQASILEESLLEGYDSDDVSNGHDGPSQFDTNESSFEPEGTDLVEIAPSLHDNTPAKQLDEDISAQLKRNFIVNGSSSGEDSDISTVNDPSVRLARAANASKGVKRKRASSGHLFRRRRRTLDIRRSPTPETDNSSLQLARASLSSQTPKSEEESPSMTAAKLQLARHLRDVLPDFCSLEGLRQHVTKSLDVIAVAAMRPPIPRRAKGGPREYMMSFTITDYSIGPYGVAEALFYRPHKESLPVIKFGDVVLFRNFTVVSLAGKGFGLRSNEGSSWAVFDYQDEPAQIRGPPVEYIQREIAYVNYLREWFNLLGFKARLTLDRVNQEFIRAGKPK